MWPLHCLLPILCYLALIYLIYLSELPLWVAEKDAWLYFSLSFFKREKTVPHKARTQSDKMTQINTSTIKQQFDEPILPAFLASKGIIAWRFSLSSRCLSSRSLYQSLAALSRAACSCRSLRFTPSNAQGPDLGGMRGWGSALGKNWWDAGDAGEGNGGKEGKISKSAWEGGCQMSWTVSVWGGKRSKHTNLKCLPPGSTSPTNRLQQERLNVK